MDILNLNLTVTEYNDKNDLWNAVKFTFKYES